MTETWVILIAGFPGSGKWTAAEYLKNQHSWVSYRFSDPLHAILADVGIPNTRDNLALLSQSLRRSFGASIMGRWVKEFILEHPWKTIILEWVRRVEALIEFEDLIDAIIWIEADPDTRYERLRARWEKAWEQVLTRTEFDNHDGLETEQSLEGIRKIAHIVVENTTTKESLYRKLNLILNRS
jgi:dephospho-CoA kinase